MPPGAGWKFEGLTMAVKEDFERQDQFIRMRRAVPLENDLAIARIARRPDTGPQRAAGDVPTA